MGHDGNPVSYGPEIKIHIITFNVFTHTAEAPNDYFWETLQYIGLVNLAIKKRPPVHSKARLQNEDLELKSLPFPGESSDLPKAGPHGRWHEKHVCFACKFYSL